MNDERPTMNESPNRELRTADGGLRFFYPGNDQEIRAVKKLENERVRYMTYAMKMQEERKEGIKEGIEQGIKEGREQGQHLANERWGKLMSLLLREKRYDDAAKAAEDAVFREKLFKEYGI